MAAWAATAYRERFPDGNLTWAVESRCKAVIDQRRLVTGVTEFPREQRWSPSTLREVMRKYFALRRGRFDWGLELHGHTKTAIVLRIAKPKKRIAICATDVLSSWMNPIMPPSPQPEHDVERNIRGLRYFGDFAIPARPIMPAAPARQSNLVTLTTSAGAQRKVWPTERWAEVAKRLVCLGFRVVALGGPGDPRLDVAGVEDMVGTLPLGETMAMVAQSRLHLAADTGSGHLAAAYGVPVVSIFGFSDPFIFRPYGEAVKVLRIGDKTVNVTVEAVMDAAEEMLARES